MPPPVWEPGGDPAHLDGDEDRGVISPNASRLIHDRYKFGKAPMGGFSKLGGNFANVLLQILGFSFLFVRCLRPVSDSS